ncbi:unnamed protein product, partial [Symbiodinium sp. KB8]
MLAVHVSSATTGQELCVVAAGRDWTVHEFNVKLAAQQDRLPHNQTLLKGTRALQKLELLRDVLDTENASTLELQLVRRSWVVTVVDARSSGESSDESMESSDGSQPRVDVEAYPECSLREFAVKIADKLALEPATRPVLQVHGKLGLKMLLWGDEAETTTLVELGIHPGTKVQVVSTAELTLSCVGRPTLQSRRSEFLESNAALCLMDQCHLGDLMRRNPHRQLPNPGPPEVLDSGLGSHHCDCLARIPGLLAKPEVSDIARSSAWAELAPMTVDCFNGTRRYQRLVVKDERFAQTLWERAKPLIQEVLSKQSKRPMGFGCAQGDWELEGLNPCFRVNSYGPQGFLKPHRDAPFSPDLNVRSLCTLLIPLSSAGRTRFFYPLQTLDSRGMTLEEELKARGGLDSGFRALDIRLEAGVGLLFGQSLLHEGIPADGEGHKMLLRTDVLVRRVPPIPRVLLTPAERKDQLAALRWFREAQHLELREQPCNELYERALSYRYFHPSKDAAETLELLQEPQKSEGRSPEAQVLPSLLLERYPHFAVPELALLKGPVAAFRLPEPEKELEPGPGEGYHPSAPQGSTSKHLRVSAMYALHLLGHHAYEGGAALYTVNFDPGTQQVTAVPLRELLQAAFHSHPLHGAVYNVVPRKGLLVDPDKDFQVSVDRTHLALQHGCFHTGQDLLAGLKSEAYGSTPGDDLREDDGDLNLEAFSELVRRQYQETLGRPSALPAPTIPDWQRYLSRLLSDEGTAPGLDVVATAIGSREKEEDEGSNVFRSEDISVQACPMNHLVFDFSKHELVVRAQAQASRAKGSYDPEALWLELLQQYRASAVVVSDCMLAFTARSEQSGRYASLTLVKDTAETLAIFVDDKPARCLARGALEVQPARTCVQWIEMDGTKSSWILEESKFEALNSFMASSGFIFERYEVSLAALAREGTSFHHAG